MPRPARQNQPPPPAEKPQNSLVPHTGSYPKENKSGGILSGLSNDDLILAAVLFILLNDGCDDKLLLAAVGFLLLGDL